ncbi:helix-turn-helix domain-containing protein [Escherichia coli]
MVKNHNMINHIPKITIEKIIERVDAEIEKGSRLSVRELTTWSGYSHRHLQRLFLMETNVPLGKYIRRRRLNRVALLLRFSQRSFQDIALSTGFDSQQSMNRDFKKNSGLTPKQYRYGREWSLSPLGGGIHVFFNISEPEQISLPGGTIVGQAFCFYGTVTSSPVPSSMKALLSSAFRRKKGGLWMIAQVVPVTHKNYHYQVTGCQGTPGSRNGIAVSYPAGKYVNISFETTQDTHIPRTHHVYLNVLPEYGVVRAPGPDVIQFRYEKEKVFCPLFIPVI